MLLGCFLSALRTPILNICFELAAAAMLKSYIVKIPYSNTKTAAAFDGVLTQLHEMLRGKQVALEILATGQNINFCFTAESWVAEVVSGQIYAICPDADILEVKDYAQVDLQKSKCIGIELGLRRSALYPLKCYTEFDGDSLSGILSVIARCIPGERVIIQIVMQPVKDSGSHHFLLNIRKRLDRFRHPFRLKYWFKKGVSKSFQATINQKTSGRLFRTNIRIFCSSSNPKADPLVRLEAVFGAMQNFNTLDLNQLGIVRKFNDNNVVLSRAQTNPFLLSTTELATLYHLPNDKEVPNLVHVLSQRESPPTDLPTNPANKEISFFGSTNFRDQHTNFGILRSDRRRHLYCVGKSGSGKSKLLELLIQNDIRTGHGVGILDPHGDLVDNVLKLVPKERIKDVVIFDPSDLNYPPSFNPLEQVPEELKMRVTIGFIEIFKKLFGTNWSPRLEHVLRYTTLALLDSPDTTVLSILKMLTDKNYRQMIVRNIKDNVVKNFWVNEFAGWSEKFDNEAITPLLNKVGQFVATNMIRNIVGQPENRINFREIMDSKKILLMKISKGILGEENAALLGAIAVTKIYQAAMARADTPEHKRVDFYFYVDEFHNFATDSFDEILSEARKYRLNLTLANQFLGQLSEQIRKTVFGNVGSLLSFRVGGEDAGLLAQEFNPRFDARDIINLGVRDFCLKMSIQGEVKEAFSGRTMDIKFDKHDYTEECIAHSRQNYARPLKEVHDILSRWEEGAKETPVNKGIIKTTSSSLDPKKEFEEPII